MCEDSRITGALLHRFGLDKPLVVYNDHSAPRVRPQLIARLAQGAALALVSDAGTPAISDPGYRLVKEAHEAGIPVRCVPGPSAPIAALSIAGLPTDRFLFAGFLPPRREARRRELAALGAIPVTLVLLERGSRLPELLADAAELLGPRTAVVARELTKIHEEVRRGTLADLAAVYRTGPPPRGEIVVLLGPPERDAQEASEAAIDAALDAATAALCAEGVGARSGRRHRPQGRGALPAAAAAAGRAHRGLSPRLFSARGAERPRRAAREACG
ncbi:MAG: rRNA small subunit methyltransferase 1 [Geminicoccaceae bacterium]|nr:rRNA small subunit methyltransferase 1 [Geminicoccaceae bacterium]